jgi:hypothetical protein
MKDEPMKTRSNAEDDPLDREIDFTGAIPNPYWLGVVDRRCVRLIAPDLLDLFPDSESVNAALRTIAEVARRTAAPKGEAVSAKRVEAPKAKRKARS